MRHNARASAQCTPGGDGKQDFLVSPLCAPWGAARNTSHCESWLVFAGAACGIDLSTSVLWKALVLISKYRPKNQDARFLDMCRNSTRYLLCINTAPGMSAECLLDGATVSTPGVNPRSQP